MPARQAAGPREPLSLAGARREMVAGHSRYSEQSHAPSHQVVRYEVPDVCSCDSHAHVLHASYFFPGGNAGEATPVPIPNTEVKLSRADGTAGETLWESRMPPGFF